MSEVIDITQPNEVSALKARIRELEKELHDQTEGALMYLAAVVAHAVGIGVPIRFTNQDMIDAANLQLERADPENGDLILRVVRPEQPELKEPEKAAVSAIITELNPVLAKAERPIILLDPNRPPNE